MSEYIRDLLREEYYSNGGDFPHISRPLSESGNDFYGCLYSIRMKSIEDIENEIKKLEDLIKKEEGESEYKKSLMILLTRYIERRNKIKDFGYDFINYDGRYPYLEALHENLKERFLIKYYNYRVGYNTLELFSYKLRNVFEDIAPEYENRLRILMLYEREILDDKKLKNKIDLFDVVESSTDGISDNWGDSKTSSKNDTRVDSSNESKNDTWADSSNEGKSSGQNKSNAISQNDSWNKAKDKGKSENLTTTDSDSASSIYNDVKPEVKRKTDQNEGSVITHSGSSVDNNTESQNSQISENVQDSKTEQNTYTKSDSHSAQVARSDQDSHTLQENSTEQKSHGGQTTKNLGLTTNKSLQTRIKNIMSLYGPSQNILRDYLNEFKVLFIQVWSDETEW